MNRRLVLLLSLLFLNLSAAMAQTYCTPTYSSSCTSDDYIASFSTTGGVSNITNNNTNCANTSTNYTYYSSMTCSQFPNSGVSFSVTVGPYSQGVKIWVDWNQDGDFVDPGEDVYASASTIVGYGTATGSFTVPPTAVTGNTRMRVRCSWATTSFTSCNSQSYGETEDYNFMVLANTPCAGAPVIGAATASPDSVCPNKPFTLMLSSIPSFSGISYQWQSAPTSTGPWTSMAGATSPNYTVSAGITSVTYYRLNATCGTSTTTSNVVPVYMKPIPDCFCIPTYTSGCLYGDYINSISLSGEFSSGFNQTNTLCAPNAYGNYTSLSPTLLLGGQTYSGQVNTGYSGQYIRIWIDFNDNAVFETSEEVGTVSNVGLSAMNYSIAIPANANPGLHRMRYRDIWLASPASSIDPCASGSYGETHDYMVIVLGPPTLTSNSPVCYGDTLTITATSGLPNPTFSFSGPGITSPVTNSTGILMIPSTTLANSGSYSVTVSSGTFTSAPANISVVINPPPPATVTATVPPTACGGSDGSIEFSGLPANTAFTLTYQKNSITQTPLTVTTNASGAVTVSNLSSATYGNIVFTQTGGCKTAPLNQVTVPSPSSPPTPSGTYNPPLCLGSSLTLTVNTPNSTATYYWSGPNNFNDSGTVVTRQNLALLDSGDYLLTVVINSCISQPGIVHVSITPPPAPPVVSDIAYCQDEVAIPLTAVGSNLKWYSSFTSTTPLSAAPTPVTTVPGTYTYYVSQSINTCEGPKDSIDVTIKPTPPAPVTQTSYVYCQYEQPITLTATGQGIRWYTSPTGGTQLSAAPTPSTLVPGTYTYYVTQTVLGCESNRLPIIVLVKPKPSPPTVTTPVRLCQYENAMPLTAVGQDLKWYEASAGGLASFTPPVPNTNYEDTLTWWVSQTVDGCESDRSRIQVIVSMKPNGIIISSKPFVCQFDTATFWYYGNARPAFNMDWKVYNGAHIIDTVVMNGISAWGIVVKFDTAGTQKVRVQVNNAGCLSDEFFFNIEVRELPILRIEGKSDVCVGDETIVSLDRASMTIDDYQWNFGSGFQVLYGSEEGPYGIKWNTVGQHVISLVTERRECLSLPIRDTVTVHDLPISDIGYVSKVQDVCLGDTISFIAATTQVYPDSLFGAGVYTYRWTPDINFPDVDSTTGRALGFIRSQAPISLEVVDQWGCTDTSTINLAAQPCCNVYMPNAFTPNGDGKNDLFAMKTDGNQRLASFRILNRWGKVVFETADPYMGWNGYTGGVAQDVGTYFYYIKYTCADGETYEKKGELTLIR